jgi:hypothetical protein
MNIREQVAHFAAGLIRASADGMRWRDLYYRSIEKFPDTPKNTVVGSLHAFRNKLPPDIVNPSRGIYRIGTESSSEDPQGGIPVLPMGKKIRESDFYEAFATWLRDELQEATHAAALGGNGFGGKWGTPDVIGLYRPSMQDIFKFPEEIISAEIKIDTQSPIVAFGQACAYKLFSHRVYIVVPRSMAQSDLERLDAIANVVGIGLVTFDSENPDDPAFQIRARAGKHEPDYFYVNKMMAACASLLGL